MRFCFFAVLLSIGYFTRAQTRLDGTWLPVRQEMGGNVIPAVAFSGQKLIIGDTTYTVVAESVDKGIVRASGNQLDIYGRDGVNKGKHFTAIYKLENGELTICYNLAGSTYPQSFDTKGQPLFFLSVFKEQ